MQYKTVSWTASPQVDLPDLGFGHVSCRIRELYAGVLSEELGAFSLHPHITYHKGVLYAAWSVHYGDEDAPGQYVRFSFSRDSGKTWADVCASSAVLFPPMEKPLRNCDEKDADGVRICGHRPHDRCGYGVKSDISWENDLCGYYHLMLCSNGFAVDGDELWAVAEACRCVNNGFGRVARRIFEDGSLGDVIWLNTPERVDITQYNPNALNAELYSNSNYNADKAAKLNDYLADPFYMPQWDMLPGGFKLRDGKSAQDWGAEFYAEHGCGCGEPTYAYRTADGVLVRFWRSGEGYQNAQYSEDGINWSKIVPSKYPDTGARTSVGNLPDGRVWLVGNPGLRRMQLVLSLSGDGYSFTDNRVIDCSPQLMKHRGRAKGTGFHYPHAVYADGKLFVVYSRNKEDIMLAEISL